MYVCVRVCADSPLTMMFSLPRKYFKAGCKRNLSAISVIIIISVLIFWTCIELDESMRLSPLVPSKLTSNCSSRDLKMSSMSEVSSKKSCTSESYLSWAVQKGWIGFPDLQQVNCTSAFSREVNNDAFPQEVTRVSPEEVFQHSKNCTAFWELYGFDRYPDATQEERDFPLAFIILFHKDLDQVLFLLRAIYRRHNIYCLTTDVGAGQIFLDAVRAVTNCFPNVILASRLEHVVYASFSRLQADINCMDDLQRQQVVKWRYVINMPGQQFPLRTNLELVKIIKMLGGRNDVEGSTSAIIKDRYLWKFLVAVDNTTGKEFVSISDVRNSDPPHGLQIVKGSAYSTLRREFVDFVLTNPMAKDLLEWMKNVYSPDEYYWATLQYATNLTVPGGYKGPPEDREWLTSFAKWSYKTVCKAQKVRGVCILSPEDLPDVLSLRALTVNKFYISHHPAALHCLDYFLYNLTVSGTTRDLSYYRDLFVDHEV